MTGEVLPYNRSLDGLRALAVGLVLIAHFPAIEGIGLTFFAKAAASGLRIGYLGVDIFFILSGYLITSILIREKQSGTFSFKRFYLKRTLRIFPIFYLTLFAVLLVFGLSQAEFWANALYVSNYYYTFSTESSPLRHTWSLSVEEQFYLFWPLIVALCPLQRLGRTVVYGVIAILAVAITLSVLWLDPFDFNRFSVRALPFRVLSLGIGAYIAIHPERVARIPLRIPLLLVFACPIMVIGLYGYDGYVGPSVQLLVMAAWSASIFLTVLLGGDRGNAAIKALFANGPMVYIGRISYGLYLYHYVVLVGLGALAGHASNGVAWQTFLAALALTFAIAAASFQWIEKPCLRLKHRLATQQGHQ